ncbi:autotransporter outer membrane beta-barrel domain-containing protein [Aquitalea aquatilis]|uniref:autotransporter family protein n=1 Tax=Aquitalea aquatilis TaxID=1537400 RepID=UPI00143CD503|nr:autotransporter outer membrane beta-barrel domain-containing protein [Aquitalea aquatilis]
MKKICSSLGMAAVGSMLAVPAFATPTGPMLWTINANDGNYGSYSSSLYGTTSAGTSSTLSWQTAGYFWSGTIGLTNAQGKLLALITTSSDNYSLVTKGANGFRVGSSCTATQCVVVNPGTTQSLLAAVNSANGGSGINSAVGDGLYFVSASNIYSLIGSTSQYVSAVNAEQNLPGQGAAQVLDNLIANNPNNALAIKMAAAGSGSNQSQSSIVSQTLPLFVGASQNASRSALSGIGNVVSNHQAAVLGQSSGDTVFSNKTVWAKPFGSWVDQSERDGTAGYKADTAGIVFGVDAKLSTSNLLGLSLAYANANVSGKDSASGNSAKIDVWNLTAYGSHKLDNGALLSLQVGAGKNTTHGSRNISFDSSTANSSYDSTVFSVGTGIQRSYQLTSSLAFTPELRADYNTIRDSSYNESGAGALNLQVDSRTSEQLTFGLKGKFDYNSGGKTTLFTTVGAGYDAIRANANVTSAYAGASNLSFTTSGAKAPRWSEQVGVGVSQKLNSGWELTGQYDVERRNGYLNQSAAIKLSLPI